MRRPLLIAQLKTLKSSLRTLGQWYHSVILLEHLISKSLKIMWFQLYLVEMLFISVDCKMMCINSEFHKASTPHLLRANIKTCNICLI